MSEENFIRFLREHEGDDPERLLLSADRWPEVDVRRAARILASRRKIRDKVPSWYAHPELDYPGSLALEQCSSEATATYKQAFVPENARIADLTGGLGVDFLALSAHAAEAYYCERDEALCEAARHNFPIILQDQRPPVRPGVTKDVMPGLTGHLHIHSGDGVAWLREQPGRFDLLYLDPARRSRTDRRVYDIAECDPNLLEIKGLLLAKASRVLAKISPMADISRTLAQFPETRELHVVATGGEVKELLLWLEATPAGVPRPEPLIVAADGPHHLAFHPSEEPAAGVRYAERPGRFLFQPSKAVLKAGAFRLLSARFGLAKLAPSTHLYTADGPVEGFPGKCLPVEEVIEWNKDTQRALRARFDRLEMTALNFPLDTDALRRRLGIAGGGNRHLFATTLSNKKKILIICSI